MATRLARAEGRINERVLSDATKSPDSKAEEFRSTVLALLQIQRGKLFQLEKYGSFRQYMLQRWGIKTSMSSNLSLAGELIEVCSWGVPAMSLTHNA